MAKTVPFTFEELSEVIEYFFHNGKNGKMWAALICTMYLTGCRISEALDLKIGQIANNDFKMYPIIQPVKLKAKKKKKEKIKLDRDTLPGHIIEQWLLDNNIINNKNNKAFEIIVDSEPQKKMKPSNRTVDIDLNSPLVKMIERWLEEGNRRFLRTKRSDYVFSCRFDGEPVRSTSAYKAFTRAYKKLELDYVSRGTHSIRKTAGLSHYQTGLEETGDGFRAMQLVQGFYDHKSAKTTESYLPLLEEVKKEFATRHSNRLKFGNIFP